MNIKPAILILFLHCPAVGPLFAQVPHLINYQSTVTRGGTNYHGLGHFKFALLDPEATRSYWSNDGTSVAASEPQAGVIVEVANGQYEVLLGDTSLTNMIPIPVSVFANARVHIRVWFSDGILPYQPVLPDQPIAAVGYAMMAANVADGAVTSAKLANGAVTTDKIAPQAITAAHLVPNAVTAGSITPGSIGQDQLAPNAAAANLQASGGLILSDQAKPTNLLAAGFTKIGTVMSDGDQWQIIGQFTPEPRYGHVAVWTGTEMIIWGGSGRAASLGSGGRYDPATETWRPMSSTSLSGNVFRAVWTGTEMIVLYSTGDGAIYNPATDTWRQASRNNAPTGINLNLYSSALWTGRELIVWNGVGGDRCYDPVLDVWKTMSLTNNPTSRSGQSAIWTGTEMIIWGGAGANNATLNSGARYNPVTDTWTPMTLKNALLRSGHSAVWTGNEMIVWGGQILGTNYYYAFANNGSRYRPDRDEWTPVFSAPVGRIGHRAVWTGSEMIVWGGSQFVQNSTAARAMLRSGARFNPVTRRWVPMSLENAPSPRQNHQAVWTGTEMIVWGGEGILGSGGRSTPLNIGGRYNPATDSWAPMDTSVAPVGRTGCTMVWTGTEAIIFGGQYNTNPVGFFLLWSTAASAITRRPKRGRPSVDCRRRLRAISTWRSGRAMRCWFGEDWFRSSALVTVR